ncbi:MAG: hypothetical protein H7Y30_09240, partial [Pyrinomonadaceae bacterium]|nr:hypothetical protein [Pyrinomonadaceae bacterium]
MPTAFQLNMKSKFFILCCIFLFACFTQAQSKDRALALIVVENHAIDGLAKKVSIVRYRFKNGEMISRDVILTESTEKLRFDLGKNQLLQNRYVTDWAGDIIDVQKKKLLHDSRLQFYSAEGSQVILVSRNGFDESTYFLYD